MRTMWNTRAGRTMGLLLALSAVALAPLRADDRDLLRQAVGDPYVFVLFDTSGSMHWAPKCSAADFNRPAGDPLKCDFLCPTGDCFTPMNGDDPASKLHQAKEALFEVIKQIDDIQFGFGTYNQDELRIRAKHWLYHVASKDPGGNANVGIRLDSGEDFPVVGNEEVFGFAWNCVSGNGFGEAGCEDPNQVGDTDQPADTNDPLEIRRAGRFPKLGINGTGSTRVYIRDTGGTIYQVTYSNIQGVYGDAKIRVQLDIRRCNSNGNSCNTALAQSPRNVWFDLTGDFISWDFGPQRSPAQDGFFDQGDASDASASGTCNGMDDNTDDSADPYNQNSSTSYDLRWPTDTSDSRGAPFHFGDLVPLDWTNKHKDDLLNRLAPNRALVSTATPDFRVATYLADTRSGTENFLRLKSEAARPLISYGSTPLGNSIKTFRTWYAGCPQGSCKKNTGWEDLAAAQDPDWGCRRKFLLVLTDGDETCQGPDACSGTAGMRAQLGIKTFVVAFGVPNTSGNRLTCMAANGGTGQPIFPQNKQQLVDALTSIFAQIRVEARSFSSASVPTVQSETSDKIYLSSFTPLPNVSTWPGQVDSFRKPLPLTADDTPDFARDCAANNLQAACHLWNADDQLFLQAPTPAQADPAVADYKLGSALDERRVLYGKDSPTEQVPTPLRLFEPGTPLAVPPAVPAPNADDFDLWQGLGLRNLPVQTMDSIARSIVGTMLQQKTQTITRLDGSTQTFDYVLGDVFHADPVIIGAPNDPRFFRQDLNGYRDFARDQFWRRKMLVVAANDGQLHFFDAGIRQTFIDPFTGLEVAAFDDGSGRELFSYMPRFVMPIVRQQATGTQQVYSLDGSLGVADVYIDPLHDSSNPPNPTERGWRTVVMAGCRECGDIFNGGFVRNYIDSSNDDFASGYFVLDVTQPDEMVTPPANFTDRRLVPDPKGQVVPSCLRLDSSGNLTDRAQCPTPAGSPFHFPVALFTFTDRLPDPNAAPPAVPVYWYRLDEDDVDGDGDPDGNGFPDLGETWSKPVIGQIQLCGGTRCDPTVLTDADPTNDADAADLEERFVAIFGGGLDPVKRNANPQRGSWLYMVDMETGEAIYKRHVDGAVPAGPAAVDEDQDGLIDVIYAVTTEGFVYKVDLNERTATGKVPALADVTVDIDRLLDSDVNNRPAGTPAPSFTIQRVIDPAWEPFKIFATSGGCPLYQTPSLLFVPDLEQFALSFGCGDRENLWEFSGFDGRFYTIVDEDFARTDAFLPQDENDYTTINVTDPNRGDNLLVDQPPGSRGWVLELETEDRVLNQAFALVGVVIFTSFEPQVINITADLDGDGQPDEACARTGTSRVFVVNAENADAITDLDGLTPNTVERFFQVADFTTPPYTDQTASKNPPDSSSTGRHTENILNPEQEALQEQIRESLKRFFPENCRYNRTYSVTVDASRSDLGFVRFATIPVAICPVDWREK